MSQRLLTFTGSNSTNHGLPHGFWWEHGTQTPAWPQAAAQAMHINMDPGGSMDYRPQHDLLWRHRSQTSAWPQKEALGIPTNTLPARSTIMRSLMRPNLENEPSSILDILLLLRDRAIVQWGSKLGAEPTLSSRLLHTSLLALLGNGMQILIAMSFWSGSRFFDF